MEEIGVSEPRRQKFVQMHGHKEVQITACAVSKMDSVDCLSGLQEYENYFVEPNQKWLEKQSDPLAWVKVYYKINPEGDIATAEQTQILKIPMPFLGDNYGECWAELQIMIKRTMIRNSKSVRLNPVQLGRHKSYDTRIEKWAPETKPITPKKDLETHSYISLRFYHQNHLPPVPADWHFEPVYVSVAGKDFYRIDALWSGEEITVAAALLDSDSPEIPKHMR